MEKSSLHIEINCFNAQRANPHSKTATPTVRCMQAGIVSMLCELILILKRLGDIIERWNVTSFNAQRANPHSKTGLLYFIPGLGLFGFNALRANPHSKTLLAAEFCKNDFSWRVSMLCELILILKVMTTGIAGGLTLAL